MIRFILSLLILCFALSSPIQAQEKLNLDEWSALPILHEGRLKPLDSFARIYLETFSKKQKIEGLNAAQWLAETIFTPEISINHRVHFSRFKNPKGYYYNYTEVSKIITTQEDSIKSVLEIPQNNQTPEQRELITLYENFILHTQLLRSITALLPLNLENNNQPKSFLDYKNQKTNKDIQKKLSILQEASSNNVLLRIVLNDESWKSPWQVVNQEALEQGTKEYLILWQIMAVSYIIQDHKNWNRAVNKANELKGSSRLTIEKTYNHINFIFIAKLFYLLSLIFLLIGYFAPKANNLKLIQAIITSGLSLHFIHLALRVYILERAPVGTLYESILFVSLICVIGLVFMALKQKNTLNFLLASLSGTILLLTAEGFSNIDNMGTLEAVLNTNFWLSTHVICITIGYGLCLITSLIAHCYFVVKDNKSLLPTMRNLAILSLLFTTIGTILGGLWADQSWGRFWGWDPKENGALLIVLWIIWILHSRLTKHLSNNGFAVAIAFLSIIVVLAWFGVNLLNVGLHSYGFISGVALGIGAFCAFETSLIGGLWFYNHRKQT